MPESLDVDGERLTLDHALAQAEERASALASHARRLQIHAQALSRAARAGEIGNIIRITGGAAESLEAARSALDAARQIGTFPFEDYLASGAYAEELMQQAETAGLTGMRAHENTIFWYPTAIQILAKQLCLKMGRRRETGLRPGHVISRLVAARKASGKSNVKQIADFLERAYLLKTGGGVGVTVQLGDIYDILTLRSADYTREDFALELHVLDRSGLARTGSGFNFWFTSSTGTHGAKGFRVLNEAGEEIIYSGIRLSRPADI